MNHLQDLIVSHTVNGVFARHLPESIPTEEEAFVRTMVTAKMTQATLEAEESQAILPVSILINKLAEIMGAPFGFKRREELLLLALDIATEIAEKT